jgi:cbb3-type cytochrome oxidase maturation protein
MDVLIMQVFVSLLLVLGSVLLFLFSAKQRDFDHADRLALLPMDSDEESRTP